MLRAKVTRVSSARSCASPLRCTSARGKSSSALCKAVASPPVLHEVQNQSPSNQRISHAWLSGKDIIVFGWASSGTSAAKLAAAHGARVLGLDEKMAPDDLDSQTRETIPAPLHDKIQTTNSLPNYDELQRFDLVVLSPGVPLQHRLAQQSLACNIPITSELAFAAALLPKTVELVCVTGTNGKSTTTSFLAQMLSAMGHRVWCGGNFGTPLSDLAYETTAIGYTAPHIAAVEVSSYQLEPEGQLSVAAACILNVAADHLERHQSVGNYAKIKAKLIDQVKPGPHGAIISEDVVNYCGHTKSLRGCACIGSLPGVMLRRTEAQVLHSDWRSPRRLDLSALQCPGQHNMVNASVAAFLASAVSPGEQQWQKLQDCIPVLVGLPHRLELVHEDQHGIKWLNDSKATNVESVQAALESLEGKAVVLLGGAAKRNERERLGFDALAPMLKQHTVISFGASANEIKFELQESGVSMSAVCDSLGDGVAMARTAAVQAGLKTVLLSPGCASFDAFKNYGDRGKSFTQCAQGRL